jgi:cytochrome c biogenesis protein CcmG, thiol:disulfide interchange protein DsbE
MRPNVAVAGGLVSGVVLAALLIVAVVVLAPEPVATHASPSPGPSVTGTPRPSVSAAAVGSSAAPSASASAALANFHVGQQAPPLRLAKVGGGTVDLVALRGRPVWVNFMRTDCPPCRDEFPLMNGFAVRYGSTNLFVVAVDIRESEGEADAFAKSLEAQFPVALDKDGTAQAAWGAIALPVHFWIDSDGIVRDGALGGIGPDIMAAGLSSILPGVTVTP